MDQTNAAQPVTNPRLEFEKALAEYAQAKAALRAAEAEAERVRNALSDARNRETEAGNNLSRAQRSLLASMIPA